MAKSVTTPAIQVLERAKIAHTVHQYEHDAKRTDFGDESVEKIGIDAARVLKTLVVHAADLPARDAFAFAVVPVAARLNLHAVGTVLGSKKVALADPAKAAQRTGSVPGGISPLGARSLLRTIIDASVQGYETVVVSGGRRGVSLELAPADLVAVTDATLADIATLPERGK